MNASRLLQVLNLLLASEEQFGIQALLKSVNDNLANLVGAPQEQGHQTAYNESLTSLKSATSKMIATFEPSQIDMFSEIGADRYFTSDIAEAIAALVRENPIAPAVARDHTKKTLNERQAYLNTIGGLRDGLKSIGIREVQLEHGKAEIGFSIPRQLFENEFDKLLASLKEIQLMLRVFSEVSIGEVEQPEVRQISSSDPIFFFGLSPETIAMIGGTITWALFTWKQVEEIRSIRATSAKSGFFDEKEIESVFGSKIEQMIDEAVKEKANELSTSASKTTGRTTEETDNNLQWVLRNTLALVERGVKIEIKALPPKQEPQEDGKTPAAPKEFQDIKKVIPDLKFPKVVGTPILRKIDPPSTSNRPNEKTTAKKRAPRRKRESK